MLSILMFRLSIHVTELYKYLFCLYHPQVLIYNKNGWFLVPKNVPQNLWGGYFFYKKGKKKDPYFLCGTTFKIAVEFKWPNFANQLAVQFSC